LRRAERVPPIGDAVTLSINFEAYKQ